METRISLDRLEAEWRDYRRGLHADPHGREDAFVALWSGARATLERARPTIVTMDDVLFAMLLHQELTLRDLRAEVERHVRP